MLSWLTLMNTVNVKSFKTPLIPERVMSRKFSKFHLSDSPFWVDTAPFTSKSRSATPQFLITDSLLHMGSFALTLHKLHMFFVTVWNCWKIFAVDFCCPKILRHFVNGGFSLLCALIVLQNVDHFYQKELWRKKKPAENSWQVSITI